MDDDLCKKILDRLAEEKFLLKQTERVQQYLPYINAWKTRRVHRMPGNTGMVEDSGHICTIGCRNSRSIHTIVPEKVYGCVLSGMVHICNRDSDCKFRFTDKDGLKKCVFSRKECGICYSHSWAQHDLYDKKGVDNWGNETPSKGIYDGMTPGEDEIGTDGVLLSSYRHSYGSQKRDDMEQDMQDGWIIDIEKEIDKTMDQETPSSSSSSSIQGPKYKKKLQQNKKLNKILSKHDEMKQEECNPMMNEVYDDDDFGDVNESLEDNTIPEFNKEIEDTMGISTTNVISRKTRMVDELSPSSSSSSSRCSSVPMVNQDKKGYKDNGQYDCSSPSSFLSKGFMSSMEIVRFANSPLSSPYMLSSPSRGTRTLSKFTPATNSASGGGGGGHHHHHHVDTNTTSSMKGPRITMNDFNIADIVSSPIGSPKKSSFNGAGLLYNSTKAAFNGNQTMNKSGLSNSPNGLSFSSPIQTGSPLSSPSVFGRGMLTPFSSSSIRGGGYATPSSQEALEEKREIMYKKEKIKKEMEWMSMSEEDRRRLQMKEMKTETPENISNLEMVTKEIIFDLLWDNNSRRCINAYRLNKKRKEADLQIEEYILKSHKFSGRIEDFPHDNSANGRPHNDDKNRKNESNRKITKRQTGIRKKRRKGRRGSAMISKRAKKCPLFPSMMEMDCMYWTIISESKTIETFPKESKREMYYALICITLWRYISYYGAPEDTVPLVPYVSFVSGLLYMLGKDGLYMNDCSKGQVSRDNHYHNDDDDDDKSSNGKTDNIITILPPDEYLKRSLPTMKDLSWRPKRKKIDGDLLALGLQKKGTGKKQMLIKRTGGGSNGGLTASSSSNTQGHSNYRKQFNLENDIKLLNDTFNTIERNRLSHNGRHTGGFTSNNDSLKEDAGRSEWDDDNDNGDFSSSYPHLSHNSTGGGEGVVDVQENLKLLKRIDSMYQDENEDNIRSVHNHKHGNREDLSVGETALYFRRRKRSKRIAKYKKQQEPPSWRPLGPIHYDKEVDEDTSMRHAFSFGNRGRLYNNSVVSQGKRYIKENLNEMSRDSQKVKGLKASLKQVYSIKTML